MPLNSSNLSARDADWRFLLPAPASGWFEHLVLLGGSPALAAILIDLEVARDVSLSLRDGARFDGAVVLAGACEPLSLVASQLGDEGVLYWETDRRRRGRLCVTPDRLMRQLRCLGLTPTGAYWVKPGFPDRTMYVPLGDVDACEWYLTTLYRATTRPRRAVRAALQGLSLSGVGFGSLAPCHAVTAVRGVARAPAVLDRARGAGTPMPRDARVALLAHGRNEWSRIAFPVFRPEAAEPLCIIKLPRTGRFNDRTESEHHCLEALVAHLPQALRDSIPASSLLWWNGLAVTVETSVPGAALTTRTGGASNTGGDLGNTARWLTAFHHHTIIERVPARDWLTRRLSVALATEYATAFGLTNPERNLFDRMMGGLAVVPADDLLPIVWQHADFGPWNVYAAGDRIWVIDWEAARHGPAVADLLYFLMHWTATGAGLETDDARVRHIESLFCAGGSAPIGGALHAPIAEYMRNLEIAPLLLPFLLLYTLLEQAIDRAHRCITAEPASAITREGNLYVGCVNAMARHAEALFATGVARAA